MSVNPISFQTSANKLPNLEQLRWSRSEPVREHRGIFSKDRDRILYSKSFLRLRGKTQVFMLQYNDYIRTRLTHTLEVNQIAKSIAIALGQNSELIEAIALGHDVGHTPFGHIGERTLCELIKDEAVIPDHQKGFKHNLQALRLLCDLEKGADYPEVSGLNLTKYVLWGIAHHSSIKQIIERDEQGHVINADVIKTAHPIYDHYLNAIKNYWSFEAMIVALADEIAQRHHDIEDSLSYGVVKRNTIVERLEQFESLFSADDKKTFRKLKEGIDTLDAPVFSSVFSRLVVNLYVVQTIKQSKKNFKTLGHKYEIYKQEHFWQKKDQITEEDYRSVIAFPQRLKELDESFQDFLKNSVLTSFQAQTMDGKGAYIIRKLYQAFKSNPCQLPDTALRSFFHFIGEDFQRAKTSEKVRGNEDVLYRCIVDYIGGMTDQYAYNEYDRLYGTKF